MSRTFALSVCLLAFVSHAADAGALDAGGLPIGWFVGGKTPQDYLVESAAKGTCGGPAAVVRSTATKPGGVSVMQVFRADKYRGMRVRLTATVTASGVTGWAGLWMRVDGPKRQTSAFDNMQSRPLRGNVRCGAQAVVLDVAQDAELIALGLVLEGPGSAELSSVDLEGVDDTVATTDLMKGAKDSRSELALGRVGTAWFTDRLVSWKESNVELKLVAPGRWRDPSGDYTVEMQGDVVLVSAVEHSQNVPLLRSGAFHFRREKDVTLIEGTWGRSQANQTIAIRYSRQAVDLKWGTYERHLVMEKASQPPEECVSYAERSSSGRASDELKLCGVVFNADAPRVQTVLSFLFAGFERFGAFTPMNGPGQPDQWPINSSRSP